MNIDISKYPVRRSNPIVLDSYGLPEDTERYIIKGQGLIGIDLDKGDNLYLNNLEGNHFIHIFYNQDTRYKSKQAKFEKYKPSKLFSSVNV